MDEWCRSENQNGFSRLAHCTDIEHRFSKRLGRLNLVRYLGRPQKDNDSYNR